ncbi:MAG: glycosyltransferase family 4 protein [Syntrophomonadaceae bacterium]
MSVVMPPSLVAEPTASSADPFAVPAEAPEDRPPRVLMIGWEFPPLVAGGLGVACEGLVRGLLELGAAVLLLLPRRSRPEERDTESVAAPAGGRRLRVIAAGTSLRPYDEPDALYGGELLDEVSRLAAVARVVAAEERFDVIHAHDWMTFPAAVAARDVAGRPFVAHVHSTEFSRSGGGRGDAVVSHIEGEGVRRAERVVCVSRFTAGVVRRRYGVPDSRIRVVHNAIAGEAVVDREPPAGPPLVLFVGRLTRQKGPARFLEAARRVLVERPDARFVLAGTGDRLLWLRHRARELGLSGHVRFLGFVPHERLPELYRRASVYVLPSVAEPFGLTVLEALRQGVPTIATGSAGVTEVVESVIRVDAGDVEALAGEILRVLDSPSLQERLSRVGRAEVEHLSWNGPASRCLEVYRELV